MRRAATWLRHKGAGSSAGRRRRGAVGRWGVAVLAAVLAVVCVVVAGLSLPRDDSAPGAPVPAADLAAIISAAQSCPAVTAPRLAGQLMATSAFTPAAASSAVPGGTGLAGLDDAAWKKWAPGPQADRGNAADNIVALAHDMCDLTGQARAAQVPGDAWQAALAAFHSGMPAVLAAKGVPADAHDYVGTVSRYAAWYAQRPEFSGAATAPSATPNGSPSGTVPGSGSSAGNAAANGWRLTWSDEFNGAAGTPPDPRAWGHDTGGDGWGNKELEYQSNSTHNAALDGSGHLVMTARNDDASGLQCWYGPCQYTSARLVTSGLFSQTYGEISARIQLPRGQGLWPTFMLLGANIGTVGWPQCGEINIAGNTGDKPASIQSGVIGAGNYNKFSTYTMPNGTFADGYHTFSADWYPDHITFAVDGAVYATQTRTEAGSGWVFDHPFFLVLDLAVGGTVAGNPNSGTTFPQQLSVDWIRVYTAA